MLDLSLLRPTITARIAPPITGIPSVVFHDNEAYDPDPGTPHLLVQLRHLTHSVRSQMTQDGHATDTGRITFTYFGVNDVGPDPFDACMNALKALFESGTLLQAGANVVNVSRATGPFSTDITRYDAGFSNQQLIVPWYALVRTAVAA